MTPGAKRAAVCAGVACAAIAYGCSLGLDPSRIGAVSANDGQAPVSEDASTPDAGTLDAADAEALADADAGTPPCVHDTDCTSANHCRVGKCDAGTCSFAVCPAGVCQGSTCSATSSCSAPATYGFHAAAVSVTAGPIGCGANASACLAAVYPFAFVGTTNGVVVYAVNDPSNTSPRVVPVTGLTFLPTFITSMGSRVYFVSSVLGTGPGYRLQIAYLDVPSDPLTASLQATTVFDTLAEGTVSAAWAATGGSLFLVDDDATLDFPTASVTPPLTDSASIPFFVSPAIPSGGAPVVASGARLVVARWQGTTTPYQTYFSLETGVATSSAQTTAEQATFATIGPTAQQSSFAQGTDGSILWNTGSTVVDDDAGDMGVRAVRLAWLLASGTATTFAPTSFVDVETYAPPVSPSTGVVGPVAWVAPGTALVLATAASAFTTGPLGLTSVQVAVTSPAPALAVGRRYIVQQGVSQTGAAASGGFGYVLAADAPTATTCTLHIFAPSCAGP